MSLFSSLTSEINSLADPARAAHSSRYFKTGPGQYGEGDKFLGLNTPQMRQLANKYRHISLDEIAALLSSSIHEFRSIALMILVHQFSRADTKFRRTIYSFYLSHTSGINNWDLVDGSAPNIIGTHLLEQKDRSILYKLALSSDLWKKRIAIISTLAFIRSGQFTDTLQIAQILLGDPHDLIHKAVGWMLREVGKRNRPLLEGFLRQHYRQLPRTTLRYAIEKFSPPLRQQYLQGNFI